ncbi:MAG: hypothetical protein IH889_03505 [Planctomycetes bacterium]|nr:hypothetical protein [Planctomycetota bacterium]
MEDELLGELYPVIRELDRMSPRGMSFSDAQVAITQCWAVINDRPTKWACQRRNWPLWARRWSIPSESTMSRRLRTPSVQALLDQLEHRSRQRLPCHWYKSIDAKPLPIGGWSRDPDARWGQAVKTKAKGYKFFAIVDPGGALETWTVGPMNDSEPLVARGMIKPLEPGGYLLGDALYDCNALYELASERGWQLVAPRKKPETGLGGGSRAGRQRRPRANHPSPCPLPSRGEGSETGT